MSGFHHGQNFTFEQGQVYAEYEEQWGAVMNGEQQDSNHGIDDMNNRQSMEQPPPGLMQGSRTDSINSTTVFVNPNEIQPQYNGDHDIQSAEHMANQQTQHHARKTPHKRRHSEMEEQPAFENMIQLPQGTVEVLNLNVDVAQEGQIIYATEDGNHVSIVDNSHLKQERNSIEPPSPGNQDSRLSWTQDTLVANPGQSPSPTGLEPSIVNWPGQFLFDVNFTQLSLNTKNKNWDYSKRLKKLFIDMNRLVQAEFRVGVNPPEGMYIRVLPVYAVNSHVRNPVVRCPNHASQNDPTNQHFPYPQHLIRVQDENAIYERDSESERLSVLFPVGAPHQGTDTCSRMVKFMCLGSDVGGINRKPVKVIFSLEMGGGMVVGRKVVDVRICSCPKRDMQQEVDKLERQEEQARSVARRLAENTHVIMGPPPKKKKLMKKGEEIIMVPVAADDFKKFNEFAEAAMIVRHPEKAEQIKEMRRKLLQEHNEELIHSLEKRKNP